jgi:hypothetical protein
MKANLLGEEKEVQHDYKTEKSALYDRAWTIQKISAYLMIICAISGLITLIIWSNGDCDGCLGGYNFSEDTFTYHPLFMYTGMILLAISSMVSYRILPIPKVYTKNLHVALHTIAIGCIIAGLTCVIVSNNYKSHNDIDAYYGNLYSLHSFVGLATIFFYVQNYFLGFYHFLSSIDFVPILQRKAYMPFHVLFGTFAFFLTIVTVELGIMELNTEIGCSYSLDAPDVNPAAHYNKLSYGCHLGNGLGIFVLLVALFAYFALYNFPTEPAVPTPDERVLSAVSPSFVAHRTTSSGAGGSGSGSKRESAVEIK